MQKKILEVVKNDKVKVYVVWTPVLQEDDRRAAVKVMQHVLGERAKHFWDADKSLGFSLGRIVTLPRERKLAWDVYFAFDAAAEWTGVPPSPADWMHQLANDERTLDGDKMRIAVEKLLEALD